MKEEIDIIEKLKDFPKGIKFYSLVYGEVKFVGLTEDRIICETPISKLRHSYNRFGQLVLENETLSSEQILYSSSKADSWKYLNIDRLLKFKVGYVIVSKNKGDFPTPWKIVGLDDNYYVCDKGLIPFSQEDQWKWFKFYTKAWVILKDDPKNVHRVTEVSENLLTYRLDGNDKWYSILNGGIRYWRITDAKKGDVLFASKPNGYSSDSFFIIFAGLNQNGEVISLGRFDNYYPHSGYRTNRVTYSKDDIIFNPTDAETKDRLTKVLHYLGIKPSSKLDKFEKIDKFDINSLNAFDKVLVKRYNRSQDNKDVWRAELFSHVSSGFDKTIEFRCVSCGDVAFSKCVPFNEDTKHLAGTTLEAPDYYINWL